MLKQLCLKCQHRDDHPVQRYAVPDPGVLFVVLILCIHLGWISRDFIGNILGDDF